MEKALKKPWRSAISEFTPDGVSVRGYDVLKELTGTRASPPKRAQPLASILSTQWASFASDPQKVLLPEQVLAASFHLFQLFPMGASCKLTQPGTPHSPAVV